MAVDFAARLRDYALLMRLDRPIGIFLLLWPALWALWIAAGGVPPLNILLIFIAGVVLMRSAGCVINDYADREFDPHVARTRNRPIAAGRVSPREALALFTLLCLVAFILVLQLNRPTILLSFAAVALAASYPFMKRWTNLPQFHLGAAFAMAIPMAFTAVQGQVPAMAWLICVITVAWAVAYDTMYAMVDREDDLAIGVKSTAILFGRADRLIVGLIQVAIIVGLVVLGNIIAAGPVYYLGVVAAAGLFAWQGWIIRERDTGACFRAFLNNNWVGMAVFLGLAADYL